MKNYYDKKDGYRKTIQQGLIGVGTFGRSKSKGQGTKEEQIKNKLLDLNNKSKTRTN